MELLLSNDDGIEAPGLAALEAALRPLAQLWVVAPEREQSAMSHAFTLHAPLRALPRGLRRWGVTGTPADAVYLALHHLVERDPALIVSGINRGSNLGSDVFYSGTVAAAMEGCLHGYPAVAASLHVGERGVEEHWDTAGAVVARVVQEVARRGLPEGTLLNVNVPNVPLGELKGLRATRLGHRRYARTVVARTDPRGGTYYWIGGPHEGFDPIPHSDGPALDAGFASVTPLHPDWTRHDVLDVLREWTDD